MADYRDEIKSALDEARKAREEAERLRREAKVEADRLKDEARRARDEARRLRDQARNERRQDRHSFRPPNPPGVPRPPHAFQSDSRDDGPGVRAEQAFSAEGVTSVQVDQTAGKLTIRACQAEEQPGVVSTGNKSAPEINITRDGERLVIEVRLSKGWLFRRRQGATTVVRLPNTGLAQLKVDNGYGETEVQGIEAGTLRVNVGAGSIHTILTRGSLDVGVGAGKVSVLSHSGLARCDSGTGDVLLDIAELAGGEYKVDVGLGRAEVRLPAGGQVFIKAASGIGKSRIEYPNGLEGSPTTLRLNSGIGECVVKTRDVGEASAEAPVTPVGTPRPQRSGRAAAASRRREAEELRVLQMLEQGKITPQDAADLIAALQGSSAPAFDDEEEPEPL